MVTDGEGGSFGGKLTGTLNALWLVDDVREGSCRSKYDEEAGSGQSGTRVMLLAVRFEYR